MHPVWEVLLNCEQIASGADWRVFWYRPTALRPFAANMEKLTLRKRARFFLEWRAGYAVYYLSIEGTLAGYCVVARGGSGRYGFSGALDILVGPIFIGEAHRGRRLSVLLLREALLHQQGCFDAAYAYIHQTNAASLAAFRSAGFERYKEAEVSPVLRRVSARRGGKYILMKKLGGMPYGQGERDYSNL